MTKVKVSLWPELGVAQEDRDQGRPTVVVVRCGWKNRRLDNYVGSGGIVWFLLAYAILYSIWILDDQLEEYF